ncbi:DUF3850 domain-containing protein [Chondrinema litorale]|uniref:DUF3850 domain-containing protein n=1 Tax=Chondrinema litorale TaxID=2994555 RepID=UPI002542E4DE|nr:DUF3850 domain-containing protein [Chondrinema litorale]UZR95922.1 DUF3850 domain-containing protein [Chondrinema litorale]
MEHEITILKKFAKANHKGVKPWELRKNDRNYKVGDFIKFHVIDDETKEPTGFIYRRKIKYLFEGGEYGLEKGYCIMTLE